MFSYYERLSPRMKAIYRASDRVEAISLREPELLHKHITGLRDALASEKRTSVITACQNLADGITGSLSVSSPEIQVLSRRPTKSNSELHGLYEQSENRDATIRLWMRTSQRKQVVAFRTFLRTLLHELCHHLDYELLRLPDSLHTEGFFKRESSLYKQLVPDQPKMDKARGVATSTVP